MSDEANAPDAAELMAWLAWLEGLGIAPLSTAELLALAGPYRRLGWRPNESEGLRFLATALRAAAPVSPQKRPESA